MKLIASDYDGTLNQNTVVSKSDIGAVKKWQRTQNLFVIVTGRSISGINSEAERFGILFDYLICNNGSEIYKGKNKRLYRADSNPDVLSELCRFIIARGGLHAAVSSREKRYCVKNEKFDNSIASSDVLIELSELSQFSYFTQVDAHFKTEALALEFADKVNQKFAGQLTAFNNGINVDIVPAGVSKTAGIYKLTDILGVKKSDIITVGDNFNDLAMLKEFGGYAIENGNPRVVSQIGNKCKSISELVNILI